MNVSFNISAVIANSVLQKSDRNLTNSLQKLSSGLKINEAKDNASGLAIAKRMKAQIDGLSIGTQSAGEGISIVEIAEGALTEIHSMMQRMSELVVKSSTGSITDSDRKAISEEVKQLQNEVERISKDTEYNGKPLLDGSVDRKGYSNQLDMKVSYFSDEVSLKQYDFTSITAPTYNPDGTINTPAAATIDTNQANANSFPFDAVVSIEDERIIVTSASSGFRLEMDVDDTYAPPAPPASPVVTLDITDKGSMKVQTGANEGQLLEIRIPEISLRNMSIHDLDASTMAGARKGLEQVKKATEYVSQVRSRLGAYQNRLEHTMASQDITEENLTEAYSRIMDVDMAKEMAEYTKYQVMVQAGTSMVVQANERPKQALQILQ